MSVQRLSRIVSTIINNTTSLNNMLAVDLVHEINTYSQEMQEFNNKLKKDNEILFEKIYNIDKQLLSSNMKIQSMESQIFSLVKHINNLENINKQQCKKYLNNCYH